MLSRLVIFIIICIFQQLHAWDFIDKQGEIISLELCQEEDLPYCEEVFIAAFSKAYEDFTPEILGVTDKMQFLKNAFSDVYDDFKDGKQELIVAKLKNEIIGFAGFKPEDKPGQIYISQLAVHPDFWQNGIGKQLVFSVFKIYEDTNHLFVIPRKINIIARDFYFKIGFSQCDYIHPGYSAERYVGYEWIRDIDTDGDLIRGSSRK